MHWKPQRQNKVLVCANTLGNTALSDSDSSDNHFYEKIKLIRRLSFDTLIKII